MLNLNLQLAQVYHVFTPLQLLEVTRRTIVSSNSFCSLFCFPSLSLSLSASTPGSPVDSELIELFDGELNPVAPKAQKKVPLPEGERCVTVCMTALGDAAAVSVVVCCSNI